MSLETWMGERECLYLTLVEDLKPFQRKIVSLTGVRVDSSRGIDRFKEAVAHDLLEPMLSIANGPYTAFGFPTSHERLAFLLSDVGRRALDLELVSRYRTDERFGLCSWNGTSISEEQLCMLVENMESPWILDGSALCIPSECRVVNWKTGRTLDWFLHMHWKDAERFSKEDFFNPLYGPTDFYSFLRAFNNGRDSWYLCRLSKELNKLMDLGLVTPFRMSRDCPTLENGIKLVSEWGVSRILDVSHALISGWVIAKKSKHSFDLVTADHNPISHHLVKTLCSEVGIHYLCEEHGCFINGGGDVELPNGTIVPDRVVYIACTEWFQRNTDIFILDDRTGGFKLQSTDVSVSVEFVRFRCGGICTTLVKRGLIDARFLEEGLVGTHNGLFIPPEIAWTVFCRTRNLMVIHDGRFEFRKDGIYTPGGSRVDMETADLLVDPPYRHWLHHPSSVLQKSSLTFLTSGFGDRAVRDGFILPDRFGPNGELLCCLERDGEGNPLSCHPMNIWTTELLTSGSIHFLIQQGIVWPHQPTSSSGRLLIRGDRPVNWVPFTKFWCSKRGQKLARRGILTEEHLCQPPNLYSILHPEWRETNPPGSVNGRIHMDLTQAEFYSSRVFLDLFDCGLLLLDWGGVRSAITHKKLRFRDIRRMHREFTRVFNASSPSI